MDCRVATRCPTPSGRRRHRWLLALAWAHVPVLLAIRSSSGYAAHPRARPRRADRRARRAGDLGAPRQRRWRAAACCLALLTVLRDPRAPLGRPDRGALPLLRHRHAAARSTRSGSPYCLALPLRRPAPRRRWACSTPTAVYDARRQPARSGPACTAASSSRWAPPTSITWRLNEDVRAETLRARAPSSAPRSTTRRPAWCSRPSTARIERVNATFADHHRPRAARTWPGRPLTDFASLAALRAATR